MTEDAYEMLDKIPIRCACGATMVWHGPVIRCAFCSRVHVKTVDMLAAVSGTAINEERKATVS